MDQSRAEEEVAELIGHFYTWWRGDTLPTLQPVPNLTAVPTEDDRLVANLMGIDEEGVQTRLRRDHRPWLARIGDELVGWGWIATSQAGIPELGVAFVLRPGDRYLWDFVTVPSWRGHGVYPALLQAIVAQEEATRFWIGHDRDNAASARGIAKAGFREVGTAHRLTDNRLVFAAAEADDRAAAAAGLLNLPMSDR